MKTANFTELRRNLRSYLDSVINDSETVIVSRDGGAAVVMLSLEEYNAIKETEYIMQSPATMAAIRKGIDDADNGRVIRQEKGESINDFLARI
ncbi:type II toxin-antitoxin system Phd/YefM family antitoxin [Xylanibacter muris]|uniref:type II toxin-antitoxin system Phd/YefM family antitoxin n=1 Tax=Xylanibacter muris TaxID=2736290 RepID=UPI0025A2956D|nr:type II toxin-antitoxin system prevent-host-death family antitoxin [Xylanibacter muris]